MTVLSILFIVFLLLLLWLYLSDKNGWDLGFVISFVFSIIIGAILIIVSIEEDSEVEWVETKVEIRKTSNYVFVVDDENDYHVFKEAKDYNTIDDATTFYREHTVNFWGYEDIEGIKYENKVN